MVYSIIRKRKGEPQMKIERNLADGYKLMASNEKHDFYIKRVDANCWFTYAMDRGTNLNTTMAGFRTKKAATTAALAWAGWMDK